MNLTITVDDEVLKRARLRALQEDMSVDAVLRSFLAAYAGAAGREQAAIADLLTVSLESAAACGTDDGGRDGEEGGRAIRGLEYVGGQRVRLPGHGHPP